MEAIHFAGSCLLGLVIALVFVMVACGVGALVFGLLRLPSAVVEWLSEGQDDHAKAFRRGAGKATRGMMELLGMLAICSIPFVVVLAILAVKWVAHQVIAAAH